MGLETTSRRELLGNIEGELVSLWQKFEEYRAEHPSHEEFFLNRVLDFTEEKGFVITDEQLGRAVEMLMLIGFGIDLAEKKSERMSKKSAPWGFEIKDKDDKEMIDA